MQIRLHITIVLLFLTCFLPSVFGQEIQFNNVKYIVEDGLPHREINTIHKDRQGFLWVGTPQGIARFDGYEFKLYDRLSEGFINQDIWRILEDADGWFWLLPEKPGENIDIWHPQRNILTSFEEKFGNDREIPECHPMEWVVSTADTSLIAYLDAYRLFRYHPDSGVDIIEIRNGSLDLETHCTLLCADDHIWAVSPKNTISKIHPSGMIVQRIVHDQPLEMERAIQNRQLPLIYFEYDEEGNNTSYILDKEGNSIQVDQDYEYPIFVQTERLQGINKNLIYDREQFFEISGKRIKKLRDTVYWSAGSIHRSVYFDGDGFLWTGNDFGLEKIHIHNTYFETYLANETRKKAIRGIYVDEEHMFLNVEHYGPIAIDRKSNYRWEPDIGEHRFGYFALKKLNNGNFISSQHNELLVFNQRFELIRRSPIARRIWAIYEIAENKLLVGAQKGLHYWNPEKEELMPYDSYNAHGILAGAFITHIEKDSDGLIYVCSDKGFFILDEEEGVLARYGDSEFADLNTGTDIIYHYYKEPDGYLWLATGEVGLMRIKENPDDISQSEIRIFQREDGLSNNVIYAFYPDNNDNLWLTSDLGLMRFNTRNNEVISYYVEDGLPDNEFNRLAHFKRENGELYFGGIDGLISFHPDSLLSQARSQKSPLVLSSISAFNINESRLVDLTENYRSDGILNINPDKSFVSINATLLNFKEVDKNRYYYRFADRNTDWQWSYDNELRFDGLKYGEHTLQIRAKDVRGNWSENELSIKMCVLRPVYLQHWFIIFVSLIVVCIIYSVFIYRTRSLRKNKERLEELVRERTVKLRKDQEIILEQASKLKSLESLKARFFANMSHELKTPLSLIMGPLRKLDQGSSTLNESDKKLISTARRNSEKLLNLVEEILDISRLERSEIILDPEPLQLKQFIIEKYQSARAMAGYKNINIELIDKTELDSSIMVDKGKLSKIIDNYISNAIKFTRPGGQIKIVVKEKKKLFRISVKDNGEGIHKDDLPFIFNRFYRSKYSSNLEGGSGIGLSLVEELAELMGGSVGAESIQGQGSSFYFEFEKIIASSGLNTVDNQVSELDQLESEPKGKYDKDLEDKAAKPHADGLKQREEKSRILIVEDNEDMRWYLNSILSDQYEVLSKSDGKQALDYLYEHFEDLRDKECSHGICFPVELIVTDLRMPVMDGFELIQNLKNHEVLRHIPCIVLTARSSAESRLKALRVGVDDYLVKPFMEEELIARVSNRVNNFNERMVLMKEEINNEENILSGLGNIAQADSEWLQKVEGLFDKSLAESQLKMDWVASQLHMSERHFQRKLKLLTGLTPSSYQKEMRLIKARDMIQAGKFKSIKEVSHAVGISSTKYFSKLFKERFGILPSQYQAKEQDPV